MYVPYTYNVQYTMIMHIFGYILVMLSLHGPACCLLFGMLFGFHFAFTVQFSIFFFIFSDLYFIYSVNCFTRYPPIALNKMKKENYDSFADFCHVFSLLLFEIEKWRREYVCVRPNFLVCTKLLWWNEFSKPKHLWEPKKYIERERERKTLNILLKQRQEGR